MKSLDDAEAEALFERYRRQRDEEAFRRLYEKFVRPLYTFAARLLGSQKAQDALQAMWERVVAREGEWKDQGPGSLKSWLNTILANLCRDVLKSPQQNETSLEDRDEESPCAAPKPLEGELTFASLPADPLLLRMIEWGLQQLSPAHRAVLLLRLEGMPYDRIAGILEVDSKRVKSRLNEARTALRGLLLSRGCEFLESPRTVRRTSNE